MCQSGFLLLYLLAVASGMADAAQKSKIADEFIDPANDGKAYILADLLFRARPLAKLSRMYPHVIPFGDMLDPSKRSYQFGFPEVLRSGISREVATEIVFYKGSNLNTLSIISALTSTNETVNFENWMKFRHWKAGSAEPYTLSFTKLLSPDFDLRTHLLNYLGNDNRGIDIADMKTKYLYRDHIQEFLIGAWESMREDAVFHAEENVWKKKPLECLNEQDVACFWRRFILVIISSKIETYKSTVLRTPTIDEGLYTLADASAVAFWLFYCKMLHSRSVKGDVVDHYCPNPCRNNPCVDMAHTMTDNCEVHLAGMHDKDFKCTCAENAKWSFSKRACVIYDRCKMGTPCSIHGTESCQYDPLTNDVTCFCKPDFMGQTCSDLRDACFERQRTKLGTLPTGNQACNVDSGGECDPVLGSDQFICRCRNGWLIDTSGRNSSAQEEINPNCQLRHDPCMSLPCATGDCVSSLGQAICQCPATHYGINCQQRRGLWSTWAPWSSCEPDCGDRRERHRSRSCLGLECLGHDVESAWCPSGYIECGVPQRLGAYRTDRWRTAFALRQMLASIAIAVTIGMGCLFACQCCLFVALKCDRNQLNFAVRERAHIHQLLAYQRMSYKTAFRLRKVQDANVGSQSSI